MVSIKRFEVQEVIQKMILSEPYIDELRVTVELDELFNEYVLSISGKFAKGSQVRLNTELIDRVKHTTNVPVDALSHIGHALITKFKWLSKYIKPKYMSIDTHVYETYQESIWNVYPVPFDQFRDGLVLKEPLSPIQWLESEPPTISEVREIELKLLTGEECAAIIALRQH
jgi:hypothetical protein